MTAIALAESGGTAGAHNPRGEDSRGLWQINVAAHPTCAGDDLYDPLDNARAAFEVSRRAATSRRGPPSTAAVARSISRTAMDAEAAARSAGDGTGLGVWTGTRGYGSPLAAGGGGVGTRRGRTGGPLDGAFAVPRTGGTSQAGEEFVRDALAQAGDRYVFGAQAPWTTRPHRLRLQRAHPVGGAPGGVDLPDGSWLSTGAGEGGGSMSVEQALQTRGALLFYFSCTADRCGAPVRGARRDQPR